MNIVPKYILNQPTQMNQLQYLYYYKEIDSSIAYLNDTKLY